MQFDQRSNQHRVISLGSVVLQHQPNNEAKVAERRDIHVASRDPVNVGNHHEGYLAIREFNIHQAYKCLPSKHALQELYVTV